MAKKAFVYDGTQWVDIAQSTTDLSNYANITTTPISGFRNAVINGDFRVWQRGTSFTTGSGTYTADRWVYSFNGTGATRTVSQQSFTPGNTISGYEPQYHLRYAQSVAGTSGTYNVIGQKIEDARTFAGQTVTISFWAKAAASTTITTGFDRNYGTGGSSSDDNTNIVSHSLTTSWQRFTTTVTIASVSGKTIGANSFLLFWIGMPTNVTFTIDIWGVQVEKGSIATPFEQRPIGTELSLCQRYFYRLAPGTAYGMLTMYGNAVSGTVAYPMVKLPTTMRVSPTAVSGANSHLTDLTNNYTIYVLSIYAPGTSTDVVMLEATTSGLTQYRAYAMRNANNTSGYIDFSAEL
jgi:hypothetical protein